MEGLAQFYRKRLAFLILFYLDYGIYSMTFIYKLGECVSGEMGSKS